MLEMLAAQPDRSDFNLRGRRRRLAGCLATSYLPNQAAQSAIAGECCLPATLVPSPLYALVIVGLPWALNIFYIPVFAAAAWRQRSARSAALLIAAPWCTVAFIWDTVFRSADGPFSSPYSYLPLFIVIGWNLVERFVSSPNESEQLNTDVEGRVAQKQAELQSNFTRTQQLEREQAIAEERSRIMSDMHDVIGGQLVSALGLAEHGQLSAEEMAGALRECLDDLRLTIDSLEPTDNDLRPVLGNFRYRVDPRLQKQGIALDWQVADIPKLACQTPRNLLHPLRILLGAFTNVLKHAHASLIRVETGTHADGQHVFIRGDDNGQGFSGQHRGHGLANMSDRARRIGGLLQIEPTASGTTLELLLPMPQGPLAEPGLAGSKTTGDNADGPN